MKIKTAIKSLESNIYWRLFGPSILKKEDEWYIICPAGIGDTYFTCALAREFLKRKGGSAFNVLVKKSQSDIPKLFPAVQECYTYESRYAVKLFGYRTLKTGRLFLGHPSARVGLENKIGISCDLVGAYKILLGLEADSTMDVPIIAEEDRKHAEEKFEAMRLPIGKTVILCPEATSIREIDPRFWDLLSVRLRQLGWTVCTSAVKDRNIVPETIPISFSLREAIPIAEKAGWVISLRSGICDLLSSSSACLSIVYPSVRWNSGDLMSGGSLLSMKLSSSAKEYVFEQGSDYESLVRRMVLPT